MTTRSQHAAEVTDVYCIDCGYALRELTSDRCPECGRGFDRNQPWTMDFVGWPIRAQAIEWLASPVTARVRRAVLFSCGMVLWGAAWLPGGLAIEGIGWAVLVLAILYGIVRRLARRITRFRRGQPQIGPPPSERYTRRQTLLVLLAMSSPIFCWPLRLNLLIHRPLLDRFAWHAYAEVPLYEPPSTPRLIGLIVVSELRVDANNVWLTVPQAGHLIWSENGPREYYSWLLSEAPWYYRWAVPPTIGKWVVVPTNR